MTAHRRIRSLLPGLVLLLGLAASPLHAQREYGGVPPSQYRAPGKPVPTVTLPEVDVEALFEEDAAAAKGAALRFGYSHEVDLAFGNSGVWENLPEGGRLWRLRVESRDALSISFVLGTFQIPPGAELWAYDDAREVVRGAYTHLNHQPNGQFAIQPIPGSAVTLEYHEPADTRWPGRLGIRTVVHDYRGVIPMLRRGAGGQQTVAGWCEVDVACPEGAPYPDQIAATVHLINGGLKCSGALLNNTAEDGRQLLLTAEHCGDLANGVFVFNYQMSGCGTGTSSMNDAVSGSIELAADVPLDFRLVEITDQLPESYDV